jgi:hypothetical protein
MALAPLKMQNRDKEIKAGFQTPIAILNFNRPQLTRQVFEVVRQIKPKRLLLIADGPRADKPDDVRLCAEVRAIFDEIDWECEVSKNFADTNMGSFKRNSTGLSWVFDNVEEAIILEDDCIPSLAFFPYCEELLNRYRDNPHVGVISGNNFGFPLGSRKGDSYFFSAYHFTWGWASWRRVWNKVDFSTSWWSPASTDQMLHSLFSKNKERNYWYKLFNDIHTGKRRNAWDYQLLLNNFKYSQLSVIPIHNLVSNIGFGPDATNCKDEGSKLHNIRRQNLQFPLVHPLGISRDPRLDHKIFCAVYSNKQTLLQRLKHKVAQLIKGQE